MKNTDIYVVVHDSKMKTVAFWFKLDRKIDAHVQVQS